MNPILGAVAAIAVVIGGARLLCRWAIRYASAQPLFLGDLQLPASYVRQIIWGRYNDFIIPQAVDAYGRYWEPGVLTLCSDPASLNARLTDPQSQRPHDKPYHFASAADAWAVDPHFISYITDFSRLLLIGGTAGGDAVYLDYRSDAMEPSVICWNSVYWRRIATNCEAFLGLLEPRSLRQHDNWRPTAVHGSGVHDCVTVALAAVSHYDLWDTDVLIDIVWSMQNEPTVVLLLDPRDARWAKAGRPDWRIWVRVPLEAPRDGSNRTGDGVTVTLRGTVREIDPDAPHATLGQALVAASRHLARSGGAGLAGLVQAYHVPDDVAPRARRYMIDVRGVERWQSYRPKIWVSEDLTEVRIE